MTVIGITGGTGGGKTSALRALSRLGAGIIDCDAVYHRLLLEDEDMRRELAARFPAAFGAEGFDRKALGTIVFRDDGALLALNAITHKYVAREVARMLDTWRGEGVRLAAVDAIALIESGISDLCDLVVGVTAPAPVRIRRIAQRDGISEEYARLRVEAQKPDSFFAAHCDHILENKYDTVEEFEAYCEAFFTGLLGGVTNDG